MTIWQQKNKFYKLYRFLLLFLCGCSLTSLYACAILGHKPKQAEALLQTIPSDYSSGKIVFRENTQGIQISYNLNALKPNTRYKMIISAGSHCPPFFDSEKTVVDALGLSQINTFAMANVVDRNFLPIIRTDAKGVALGVVILQLYSISKIDSMIGKLITLHADDDFNMSSENEEKLDLNKALACGVIQTK